MYDYLQMGSAGFLAFNNGLNDGQKFMGVFALTLLAGGVTSEFVIAHGIFFRLPARRLERWSR